MEHFSLISFRSFLSQSDLENCREELEFTNHKNVELEKIISVEREKVRELDGKLKVRVASHVIQTTV